MQMVAFRQQDGGLICPPQLAARAVLDIENKVAIPVVSVANKGASGHLVGKPSDTSHIDTVGLEAFQVDPAEVIIPNAADDAASLAELGYLIDKDRRCSAGKGAYKVDSLPKTSPALLSHDLHKDLSDSHDLGHIGLRLDV